MKVIEYEKKYKKDFIELNKNWIQKYFTIEEHDLEQLDNVEHYLSEGAMIFFAVEDEQILSTCMALQLESNVWEICKFATNEKYKGRGAGKAVFQAAMDYAIKNKAKKSLSILTKF